MVEPYNTFRTPQSSPNSKSSSSPKFQIFGVIGGIILLLIMIWSKTDTDAVTGERRNAIFNGMAGVLGIREYIPSNVANTLGIQGGAPSAGSAGVGGDPAFAAAAGYSELTVNVVNAVYLGFDMIEVNVDIVNNTVFAVRNPVIACDHLAGNGTVITTSEYQVYQDIPSGETARAKFSAVSSSQAQEVVCEAR